MTPIANEMPETIPIPEWTNAWYCGHCGQPWPCGCSNPVRICVTCGGDDYDCHCDEGMYIEGPDEPPPDWTEDGDA